MSSMSTRTPALPPGDRHLPDPGHGRLLPAGLPVARILRTFFVQQYKEVAGKLAAGHGAGAPRLDRWLEPMVKVLMESGYFQRAWEIGQAHAVDQLENAGRVRKGLVVKSAGNWLELRVVKDFTTSPYDVWNPRILDAIHRMVFDFAASTLATATADVDAALAQLRVELSEGLAAGEASRNLSDRVYGIFHDAGRAHRIAATEASRAVHGGELLAYKDSGVVERKAWEASSDACDRCLVLAAMDPIPLDQPFVVLTTGSPAYRVVMHPGLHPFCFCTMTAVL